MRYYLERMMTPDNQAITTEKRWRKTGRRNQYAPMRSTTISVTVRASTRWIEDGSYARLKFITLTYSVPRTWTKDKTEGR